MAGSEIRSGSGRLGFGRASTCQPVDDSVDRRRSALLDFFRQLILDWMGYVDRV